MTRNGWERRGIHTWTKRSHDGWTADVYRCPSGWRYAITDARENTDRSSPPMHDVNAAKAHAWRVLEAMRARARNAGG